MTPRNDDDAVDAPRDMYVCESRAAGGCWVQALFTERQCAEMAALPDPTTHPAFVAFLDHCRQQVPYMVRSGRTRPDVARGQAYRGG